ncbi:MAG: hypothetical protein JWR18_1127 [Segetibacter sp.]|nr:hypothetical protein [Segetibacter sp.]
MKKQVNGATYKSFLQNGAAWCTHHAIALSIKMLCDNFFPSVPSGRIAGSRHRNRPLLLRRNALC